MDTTDESCLFSESQSERLLKGLTDMSSSTIDSIVMTLLARGAISEAKTAEVRAMQTKDEAKCVGLLFSILVALDLYHLTAVRDLLDSLRETEVAVLLWEVVAATMDKQSVCARRAKMEAKQKLRLNLDSSYLKVKRQLRFDQSLNGTDEENDSAEDDVNLLCYETLEEEEDDEVNIVDEINAEGQVRILLRKSTDPLIQKMARLLKNSKTYGTLMRSLLLADTLITLSVKDYENRCLRAQEMTFYSERDKNLFAVIDSCTQKRLEAAGICDYKYMFVVDHKDRPVCIVVMSDKSSKFTCTNDVPNPYESYFNLKPLYCCR
jgi:hypothetical protein